MVFSRGFLLKQVILPSFDPKEVSLRLFSASWLPWEQLIQFVFFDMFLSISISQHFRNTDRQTCVLVTFQCCLALTFSLVILPWFDFVLLPFVDCTDGSIFLPEMCLFYGHPANHDVLEDAFVGSQCYVF